MRKSSLNGDPGCKRNDGEIGRWEDAEINVNLNLSPHPAAGSIFRVFEIQI
jgi:hypothetical protein